jgi:flagellar motility protein MotE (MotC chaperone)
MNILDEYRRKLSLLQTENMAFLGDLADTEKRMNEFFNELKKKATKLYEEVDDILDMEIKK